MVDEDRTYQVSWLLGAICRCHCFSRLHILVDFNLSYHGCNKKHMSDVLFAWETHVWQDGCYVLFMWDIMVVMDHTLCIVAVDLTGIMSKLIGTKHVTYNIKSKHTFASHILKILLKPVFMTTVSSGLWSHCLFSTKKALWHHFLLLYSWFVIGWFSSHDKIWRSYWSCMEAVLWLAESGHSGLVTWFSQSQIINVLLSNIGVTM